MDRTRIARLFVVPALLASIVAAPAVTVVAQNQDASPIATIEGSPQVTALPPVPAGAEVVAAGLDNPRHIAFGPDGALYIAEAGGGGDGPCVEGPEGDRECYGRSSAIARVDPVTGDRERIVEGVISRGVEGSGENATGIHDLAFVDDTLYAVVGVGADPNTRAEAEIEGPPQLGRLFAVDTETGELTEVADIAGHEERENPDGDNVDSNPYALDALPDGTLVVADAGGNSLLGVAPDGTIETLAVFPVSMQAAPDGSEIPMQAVPNAVAVGPDGDHYVGQLTGFPFPAGGATVFRVPAEGGEPEPFAEGFTNIIDVAFGPDGGLYVLEFNSGGLTNIDPADPTTLEGRLVRVAPDGEQEEIAGPGLIAPSGLAVDPDGRLYVAYLSVAPGAGTVVRFAAPSGAEATPQA